MNNNVVGNFDGGFAPGDFVLSTRLTPMTINFDTPVRAVGAQIQDELGDNSNIFLGVRSDSADITSVTYLTVTADPFRLKDVSINQMSIDAPAHSVPGPTIGADCPA